MKKKTKSIKPPKEKIMPIKRQIALISTYLSNRNIDVRKGEIADFVSPDLHYDENKSNVLAQVYGGMNEHRITDVEALIYQAEKRDAERSSTARLMDWRKRAKHTWTPKQLVKDPSKADKWFNQPNRYDIVGIDVKEGLAVIKRKKVKKKATIKKGAIKVKVRVPKVKTTKKKKK